MVHAYRRSDRVGDLIRQEIASILLHGELRDPRIGFVTITHVKMTPDLRDAKIYFSQLGTEKEKKESCAGLNSASGYLRRMLAKQLRLRTVPKVSFYYDETMEYSDHIGQVLHGIKDSEQEQEAECGEEHEPLQDPEIPETSETEEDEE
jgi:ribosome-binding factor A